MDDQPLPVHKHRKMHTQTPNIHALSGIRTHDPGFRASYRSATVTGIISLVYLKYITFQKFDLLPSSGVSGVKDPTQLCLLEIAILDLWAVKEVTSSMCILIPSDVICRK
jgi:hypothetical protein